MYRVTTTFTGPLVNGGGINRLYFDEAGGTAAQAHAAVTAFWQAVDELMHVDLAFSVEGEVELVDETGAITGVENTDTVSGAGANTGDPLPPATQGLVRWRSGLYVGGRELRGRTFIPGISELMSGTNGRPSSGALTVMNVAAGNLIANGTSELRVFSRTKSASATVVAGQAWNQWAQLRSRRD